MSPFDPLASRPGKQRVASVVTCLALGVLLSACAQMNAMMDRQHSDQQMSHGADHDMSSDQHAAAHVPPVDNPAVANDDPVRLARLRSELARADQATAQETPFDLFDVENPIDLSLDTPPTANVAPTVIEPRAPQEVTSPSDYDVASTVTARVPLSSTPPRTDIAVKTYNHIPGSSPLNVGDSFTFSNPTISYYVRSITVDSLFWETDTGRQQVTTHNLLLPALSWVSDDRGFGSRELSNVSGNIFPLRVGNRMSFDVATKANVSPYRWQTRYDCLVVNRGIINVIAGEFDTFIVTCTRDRRDELTFYFAPALGNYVRLELKDPNRADLVVRELVAYERPTLTVAASGLPPRAGNPNAGIGRSPGRNPDFRSSAPENNFAAVRPASLPTRDSSARDTSTQHSSVVVGASPGSGYYAHLASYLDEASLQRGWGILQQRHSNELGRLSSSQVSIYIPDTQQRFLRLLAGPLVSLDDARQLCSELKSSGASYCEPVSP